MLALSVAFLGTAAVAAGFDNSRYDNLAVYWGQNSYGAANGGDTANFQKTLSEYCNDDTIDAIPVAFANVFFGEGGLPVINLANTCNPTDNGVFPGTGLADCSFLSADIETCQSKNKIVTLSLGGATGSVGFDSVDQAEEFAGTVWDLFLGGESDTRPFGGAVLDGVDLDIEGGTGEYYVDFVSKIQSLGSGAGKKYYITAAPQCVFPDAALGNVLNEAAFDAIYVQFYNNPCGVNHYGEANNWNFGIWDAWARGSLNPDVKVYIGAPASTTGGGGYVDLDTLSKIAKETRRTFPSFGGVMLWDASQAAANGDFGGGIKSAMVAEGGEGFDFPACSEPAWDSATGGYTAGAKVSHNGYIWQAKWWSAAEPTQSGNGDWSAISACEGDAKHKKASRFFRW